MARRPKKTPMCIVLNKTNEVIVEIRMLTSNTIMNVSNYTEVPSLDEIEKEYFRTTGLPGVVFLSVLSFVGGIGNIHILIVYAVSTKMAKRQVRVFILWASAIDLIACIACMPFEMFDILFSYTFSSAGVCRFFKFLSHAVSLSSGGFLAAIAIQRFKMTDNNIPRPAAHPNTVLNIISVTIVVIFTVISVPALIVYGLDKNNTTLSGHVVTDCTVLSEYKILEVSVAYGSVIIVLGTCCCFICVGCYGKILYVICTQMKIKANRNPKKENLDRSPVVSSKKTEELSETEIQIQSNTYEVNKDKALIHSGYEKGRQLTIGLIAATTTSYIGYLIYVSTAGVRVADPSLYENMLRPAETILFRIFFINNAANPVMFFLLDGKFRAECLQLYKKTTCWKKIRQRLI